MFKNHGVRIIVAMFLLLADTSISQDGKALSFAIEAKKRTCLVGEPIMLWCRITNESETETYNVNTETLMWPPSFLTVISPNGQPLSSSAEKPAGDANVFDHKLIKRLKPGENYSYAFDLQESYPTPYPAGHPSSFDTLGEYVIQSLYTCSNITSFAVKAKPIVIEITSRSPEQIQQLREKIKGAKDSGERLQALSLLRRERSVGHLAEIVEMLKEGIADVSFRREAARTIYELADRAHLQSQSIIDLLKCDDPSVQGYLALTLGKLNERKAVPALIELCDSTMHPESYRPALRALGQIGDERAIGVVERIADNDPSKEIRDLAKRILMEMKGSVGLPKTRP